MEYEDPETRKIRKAHAKLQREQKIRDELAVQSLMSTPGGRAWMHDILVLTHVFVCSIGPDSHTTYFREGERNIGLYLLNQVMAACPEAYIQMMAEHNNERHIFSTEPGLDDYDDGGLPDSGA